VSFRNVLKQSIQVLKSPRTILKDSIVKWRIFMMLQMGRAIVVILVCLGAQLALAQCAGYFVSTSVTCTSDVCNSSGNQITPGNPGEYGTEFVCSTFYCCGVGYPSCGSIGIGCFGGYSLNLGDSAIRQRLLDLARTQDISVASCGGEYRPLSVALADLPNPIREKRTFRSLVGGGE